MFGFRLCLFLARLTLGGRVLRLLRFYLCIGAGLGPLLDIDHLGRLVRDMRLWLKIELDR